jgi:hypothetical protein
LLRIIVIVVETHPGNLMTSRTQALAPFGEQCCFSKSRRSNHDRQSAGRRRFHALKQRGARDAPARRPGRRHLGMNQSDSPTVLVWKNARSSQFVLYASHN